MCTYEMLAAAQFETFGVTVNGLHKVYILCGRKSTD